MLSDQCLYLGKKSYLRPVKPITKPAVQKPALPVNKTGSIFKDKREG